MIVRKLNVVKSIVFFISNFTERRESIGGLLHRIGAFIRVDGTCRCIEVSSMLLVISAMHPVERSGFAGMQFGSFVVLY